MIYLLTCHEHLNLIIKTFFFWKTEKRTQNECYQIHQTGEVQIIASKAVNDNDDKEEKV